MIHITNQDHVTEDKQDNACALVESANMFLAKAFDKLAECYDNHSINDLRDSQHGIEDIMRDLKYLIKQIENGDHDL
jgi:hypothetical protein